MIVGDADGVIVIPRALLEEAAVEAQKKIDAESLRFAAIDGGDIEAIYPAWLIPTLRAKGVLRQDETI